MENGVYLGKKGQLLEDIAVPEDEQLSENAGAVRSFAERYPDIPVTVMLVPDAACVLSESLPAFAGGGGSAPALQYGGAGAGRYGDLGGHLLGIE